MKWREKWSKMILGFFGPPTKKSNLVKNKKNKNCMKCREKWSKMIFGFFGPPTKKIGPPPKKIWSKMKKIKVVPNWPKWRENWSEVVLWIFSH